jgi:hypothetical protein
MVMLPPLVFPAVNLFHPSLTFSAKSRSLPSEWSPIRGIIQVCSQILDKGKSG